MTDRYTKVILTVIAACLLWICARDVRFAPTVYAQRMDGSVVKVQIVSIDKAQDSRWEAVPVRMVP